MTIPNFNEFYHKRLIPMSKEDHENFCSIYCKDCSNCIKANHWLIAIEGLLSPGLNNKYEWHVVVYPANEESNIWNLKYPYYTSMNYLSFSEAVAEAKVLENRISNHELTVGQMLA